MSPTEAMSAVVLIVTGPTIMHRSPLEKGPNSKGVEGLLPSFAVPAIAGKPTRCRHMHPVQDPLDPYARFVGMKQLTLQEQRFHALVSGFKGVRGLLNPIEQGSFREAAVTEIGERLTHPLHRQKLKVGQIDSQGLHAWAIMGSSSHRDGKAASAPDLTVWATDFHHLMLFYLQTQFWQIVDLTPLFDFPLQVLQILVAVFALLWTVHQDAIGLRYLTEGVAGMALLSA